MFDKNANLCAQLPQFKEEIFAINLNDDGTIDKPVKEPAISAPGEPEPLHFPPELNISQDL